jgi:hypothetical protein
VSSNKETAALVATAMQEAFLHHAKVQCDTYVSQINEQGAKILEE